MKLQRNSSRIALIEWKFFKFCSKILRDIHISCAFRSFSSEQRNVAARSELRIKGVFDAIFLPFPFFPVPPFNFFLQRQYPSLSDHHSILISTPQTSRLEQTIKM